MEPRSSSKVAGYACDKKGDKLLALAKEVIE